MVPQTHLNLIYKKKNTLHIGFHHVCKLLNRYIIYNSAIIVASLKSLSECLMIYVCVA